MARLDRATQPRRVCAANDSYTPKNGLLELRFTSLQGLPAQAIQPIDRVLVEHRAFAIARDMRQRLDIGKALAQ